MELEIIDFREPTTEQDVLTIESLIGVTLPLSYRDFILAHNGGHPRPDRFPVQETSWDDFGQIDYFLCIKNGDMYDLTRWINRYKGRIPTDLMPIAVDPGGNLICLCVSGRDVGKLYFWDHENEVGEGDKPWWKNLHMIAESFVEFIGSFV